MQYRCFKISGKYSLPLLGAYLRENQFIGKDGFSRGFFVEIIGNEFIKSRFIEKTILTREIELPNQEIFFENYTKLLILDFFIKDSYLRVDTPAKSYISFFNFLAEISDFKISISPIQLNLYDFINNLKIHFDEINIKYIDVSDIRLTKNITARIAVQGERDLNKFLNKMLRKKEARIISLKVDLLRHDIIYPLSIASNLRIKCHKGNFEEISDLIFDSIKATSPN